MDLQARWLTGCLLGLVAANALLEDEVEASVLFHFEFPLTALPFCIFTHVLGFHIVALQVKALGKRPSEEHIWLRLNGFGG